MRLNLYNKEAETVRAQWGPRDGTARQEQCFGIITGYLGTQDPAPFRGTGMFTTFLLPLV